MYGRGGYRIFQKGGGGLRPALRNAGWGGVSASGPIAVPYMKGGVATPNPPPPPWIRLCMDY